VFSEFKQYFKKYRVSGFFSVIVVIIVIFGIFSFLNQKSQNEKKYREELKVIADFKAKQISDWFNERMAQANFQNNGGTFAYNLRDYAKNPSSAELRNKVKVWLDNYVKVYHYSCATVYDSSGKILLCLDSKCEKVEAEEKLARLALKNNEIELNDIYSSSYQNSDLNIAVPLKVIEDKNIFQVGVLVLKIDPKERLFPLLNTWPTPRKTVETLLFRRESNKVVLLSEARIVNNVSPELSYNLNKKSLPIGVWSVAKDVEGFYEGLDCRGIEVLVYAVKIPATHWWMVAKIDSAEFNAPVVLAARNTVFIVLTMIIICFLFVYLVYYRDRSVLMEEKNIVEMERTIIAHEKDFLAKYSNDTIMIVDEYFNILDVNESGCRMYGYTREEILSMKADNLRPPEMKSDFKKTAKIMYSAGNYIGENIHIKKNGERFPIEVSSNAFEKDGKKHLHVIIRDISVRKQIEAEALLQQSKYKELFDNIADCVVVCTSPDNGESFNIVDINKSAEVLEKVNKKDIIGKSLKEIFPGVVDFGLYEILGKVWQTGIPEYCPPAFYKDDKIEGWRENYVYRLPRGEVVAVYKDLTKEKNKQDNLNFLYKSSLETGSMMFNVDLFSYAAKKISELDENIIILASAFDEKTNILKVKAVEGLGLMSDTITGLLGKDILNFDLIVEGNAKKHFLAGRMNKVPVDFYEFNLRAVPRPVCNVIEKMLNFESFYAMGIVHDKKLFGCVSLVMRRGANYELLKIVESFVSQISSILQRRLLEEERMKMLGVIEKTEEKYLQIFNLSPLPIMITRLDDGCFIEVNDSAVKLIGAKKEYIVGKTSIELGLYTDPEDRKKIIEQLQKCGVAIGVRVRQYTLGGKELLVLQNYKVLDIEGVRCVLTITQDITEHKQLKNKLIQAQKLEAVGQLASGVSHEFNNLLTIISLAMEEAKRKNTLEFYSKITNTVIKTSKQAASIAKRLNEFAKKREIAYRKQTVTSVVDYILELLNNQALKKNIIIEKEYLFEEEIYFDDTLLLQVILNVVQNAIHAVKNEGKIKVSVREDLGVISIIVSDNGIGISKEHLSKIFDPFFTTKGAFGTGEEVGTGLGLSVSYSIMQSLAGDISAESEAGKGSTFTIRIQALKSYNPVVMKKMPLIQDPGKLNVLIAEEKKSISTIVSDVLKEKCLKIIVTDNGQDAFNVLGSETIDLLIAELNVPALKIEETLALAREKNPKVSVIILTDVKKESFSPWKDKIDKAGGAEVLHKPFKEEEVKVLLEKITKEQGKV